MRTAVLTAGVVLLVVLAGCLRPPPVTSQTESVAPPAATAGPTGETLRNTGPLASVWGKVPKECT